MPHILGIPHSKQPIVGGLAGKAIDFLASRIKQQTQLAPQKAQQPFRPTYQQATQVAQNIRPSAPIPQRPVQLPPQREGLATPVGRVLQKIPQSVVGGVVGQGIRNTGRNLELVSTPQGRQTFLKTNPAIQNYKATVSQLAKGDVTNALILPFMPAGIGKVKPKLTTLPLSPIEGVLPSQAQNPVQKIISALTQAKPLRGQQETLYSAERGTRFAKSQAVRERIGGEAGAIAGRKQLAGELPKVQFESIRPQLNQQDIDSLFNQISNHPTLMEGQKTNAITGLDKLLGERGGGVPTNSEIKLLDQIFGQDFTKAITKNRNVWDKILANAGDAINVPRAVSASLDLSAPLRQGLPLITRGEFWKALPGMVKSLVSEKAFQGIQSQIASHPMYQAMQDARLALTDINGLTANEDAFISHLAGKIPGIRASNRAYIGFLNKLRADTFASLAKGLEKEGRLNPDSLKSVADFVNAATGRGNFSLKVGGGGGILSEAQKLLNATFFSPRLIASRLQLLNPQFYIKQDPYIRKEAIKSILGATTAILSVLGLAKLAGAQVGTDPRNADFAKAKVGNTRYDVTGGFGAYIRIASQLISGKLISSTTGKETTLGEGYKPLTRFDILLRFLQNKESPVASLLSSMLQGKNPVGEPLDFTSKDPFNNPISKLFIPMLAQDFKDAYDEWGSIGQAGAISVPAVFGVGAQTYGYALPEKLKAETEGMTREQKNAFRDQAQQIAVARAEGQQVTDQKTQAMDDVMKELKGMDVQTRAQNLQYLQKNNPRMFKEIMEKAKESYKDQQRGLTPIDKDIKNLPIIARVNYIKTQGKNMTVEQRVLFLQELQKKGILTKEVFQQLQGGQ